MSEPGGAGSLPAGDVERGLVSVIIPARNAARWIGETLESALAQTHAPLEVLVVDNGSTDRTRSIVEAFDGVRIERCAKPGPGTARNQGLEAARGEFVQFLDADDLLASDKVARQVTLLNATGADVAWEPFHMLVPRPSRDQDESVGYVLGERVSPRIGGDLAASLLSARGFVQIGAMLVRRSACTAAVRFPPGRAFVEDVRYAVELAMRGARFASSDIGKPGLLYRQYDGDRYSARPRDEFARACARTAEWAQAVWEASGGLTAARRAALGDAYLFAARQLAAVDAQAFDSLARRLADVDPLFARRLPVRVRWLARLVGYPRAEAVATRFRRVRARFSGAEGTANDSSGGPLRGAA